jgi:hypothetical protein
MLHSMRLQSTQVALVVAQAERKLIYNLPMIVSTSCYMH